MLYLSDVGVLCLVFSCACIVCPQGAAKVLIFPVVQQFTEAFVQALQMPDGPTSDSGFKMEVLKVSLRVDLDLNSLLGVGCHRWQQRINVDLNSKFRSAADKWFVGGSL